MRGTVYVDFSGWGHYVRGDFDADEARAIGFALERDGMAAEAGEWLAAADRLDEIEIERASR